MDVKWTAKLKKLCGNSGTIYFIPIATVRGCVCLLHWRKCFASLWLQVVNLMPVQSMQWPFFNILLNRCLYLVESTFHMGHCISNNWQHLLSFKPHQSHFCQCVESCKLCLILRIKLCVIVYTNVFIILAVLKYPK